MKLKTRNQTITTREDSSSTDYRFSLFYENAHSGDNGLYGIIGDNDKNSWKYNEDKDKTNIQHLPAENTVFINANVALTDGSSKKFNIADKTLRTIPNLYDALTALATKISNIDVQINKEYSTADKCLYVTKDESNKTVTISPGKVTETNKNATDVDGNINSIHITSGNKSTSIAISNNDILFTIKPDDNSDSRTYNLGAIIEAIQELNRRTAFIDSTMNFHEAKTYLDTNDSIVEGAMYQGLDDELPAATDSHQGISGLGNTRSISNSKVSKMNIISCDPETIDNTDKNIPLTQEISTLNKNSILDDPTVISPESVAIRMRGCPYLLE